VPAFAAPLLSSPRLGSPPSAVPTSQPSCASDQAGADRQGEREPAWALLVRAIVVEARHVVGSRGGDPVAEHAGHRGGRAHPVGRSLVERADGQAGQVLRRRPRTWRGDNRCPLLVVAGRSAAAPPVGASGQCAVSAP
jgi:hypothetical protein